MKITIKFIEIAVLFLLIGCGAKTDTKIPDNMVVMTPDGKEIYLYMEREEVEIILGTDYEKDYLGFNDYSGLKITYTNNLLSSMVLSSDEYKLKSGEAVGIALENIKDNEYQSTGLLWDAFYIYDIGEKIYTREVIDVDSKEPIPVYSIQERAFVSLTTKDDEITNIYIMDSYVSRTFEHDE